MENNTDFFFKLLNNEFRKLLQKVRSFPPLIINERLLEAGIFLSPKMVILEYNLKGRAFIRASMILNILGYLICIIININENLKMS